MKMLKISGPKKRAESAESVRWKKPLGPWLLVATRPSGRHQHLEQPEHIMHNKENNNNDNMKA